MRLVIGLPFFPEVIQITARLYHIFEIDSCLIADQQKRKNPGIANKKTLNYQESRGGREISSYFFKGEKS